MSPAALRAQAARLRATAESLPRALTYVIAATGPEVWRGPAAKAFETELERRQKHLKQCSEELVEIARRLLKMAEAIEQREAAAAA